MKLYYEAREGCVQLRIYERKGVHNAFFPYQRKPHMVGGIWIDGECLVSSRVLLEGATGEMALDLLREMYYHLIYKCVRAC